MDTSLHQHRSLAAVLGLSLALLAAVVLVAVIMATALPAQAQSIVPAALTPTPTATPIIPPEPPTIIAPADGDVTTGADYAPLGMATFTWSPPSGATLSHIQVSNTSGLSVLLVDEDTEATSYTPIAVWPDGGYYWRVKVAVGASGKRVWSEYTALQSFTKDWSNSGQIRPTLLQPPNGEKRSSFVPGDFAWMPVPGAAGYLLEIADDDLFAAVIYKAETLKAQHTPSVRLASRLDPNFYHWRVTPFAYTSNLASRVYGAPSLVGRFQIDWMSAPQQLGPADNIDTPFVPRFQWQAVEGAKTYQLQVGTDSDFNPTTTYNTSNTDFTPNLNLSNDKDYYWHVKAADQNGNETQWSTVRSFHTKWNFAPKLLTPANNQIQLSYPLFSWEPVPGAEQYQVQIDDTNQFAGILLADEKLYNVTTYAHPDWSSVPITFDAFWRVRAIDASGNFTPWSETRSFRTDYTVAPDLIYPPYTFVPDAQNLPVHRAPTLAWPLFVWDTAHMSVTVGSVPNTASVTVGPDYYWLMVDDEPNFSPPVNFSIKTRTLGAAPILYGSNPEHAFSNLQNGTLYYWRVRAFRNDTQMGQDARWEVRYDRSVSELAASSIIAPTFPRNGYQAVASPPVLGWLPVVIDGTQAANYHVQISRTPDFSAIVDEAYPQFVNYVPWQGRSQDSYSEMPPGVYWWRVRAESGQNAALGDWSEARSFALSLDLLTGNQYDFRPASLPASLLADSPQYLPTLTQVATTTAPADAFRLDRLHVLLDRSYVINEANIVRNLNWAFAFNIQPTPGQAVRYGIYIDNNHVAPVQPCANLGPGELDTGGTSDPIGQGVAGMPLYSPEYVLYVDWSGSDITSVNYYRWNGTSWNPACQWAPAAELKSLGGWYWYDPANQAIQLLVPYTALGGADDNFSGSLAVTLFSTGATPGDVIHNSIPTQGALPGSPANFIDNPVFLSDMLEPLYPFDMPLSNPYVHQDMPPLRWRMPIFDSVDGYQVELARDERFSQVIETWETYETQTWSFFALLPATFQSQNAISDNESYYWRVRIRHEKRDTQGAYDYGPWSPPQRFKLDSRMVGNPRLSTGSDVFMTPTFEWDRVEGAASYRLQVDDDPQFGTPLIDVGVDGTSYTPQETSTSTALSSHLTYYWRVAIRRSDSVLGAWTPAMTLDKNAVAPVPLSPLTSSPPALFTETPTFVWSAVLTPASTPRLAAPLYQLQVDNNSDFKSPEIDVATTATSHTPIKGKSLADGTWYWRVAMYEATGKPGPWSAAQTFNKQYPLLTPIAPSSGGNTDKTPRFAWLTAPGAASYILEIAQDSGFQNPSKYTTSNTSYTPKEGRKNGVYYWRVKMVDHDGKEGPILPYRFNLGQSTYLPFVINGK